MNGLCKVSSVSGLGWPRLAHLLACLGLSGDSSRIIYGTSYRLPSDHAFGDRSARYGSARDKRIARTRTSVSA